MAPVDYAHNAHAWAPEPMPATGLGFVRRHPNAVAFVLMAIAASLMAWGAVLFYGHGLASGSGGHYAVNGMESFAVFAAVPGQVLASLLMWLAVRSYVRTPPRLLLIVALLVAGHVAGIAISALFAQGMLLYAPLLWVTPSPGMALILLGPAVALGLYFRRTFSPGLPALLAAGLLTVALGMFAWSVLGYLGGVNPTSL